MDLSNSIILPREDYIELTTTAFGQTSTVGERVAGVVHTTLICAAVSGMFVAGSWGWALAMDWREERQLQRAMKQSRSTNIPQ